MKKAIKKTVNVADLIVDLDLNVRQKDNYDLPTLCEQIVSIGRILKPLAVKPAADAGKYIVLQGNRRALAAQKLAGDPTITVELAENLKKIDVLCFEDLTPNEELSLIMDHGSEKPISRTEVVTSIWRLSKAFLSEGEIITLMYFALAKYTGNEKKLLEVPSEPAARAKFLKSWLHGTVGNYILRAAGMGDYVRQQFILSHRQEDKLLTPEEKTLLTMKTNRERIDALSKAITADEDAAKGGKGWTPPVFNEDGLTTTGGGENFNAAVEKFKAEDAGGIVAPKPSRPSVKELTEKANVYKSVAVKTALAIAAGENVQENGKKLLEYDDALHLVTMKCEILSKFESQVKDANVLNLVKAILRGPAGGVQEALKPFIS